MTTRYSELDYDKKLIKIERENTGSYYTPCSVASAMVRVAIYDYIEVNLKGSYLHKHLDLICDPDKNMAKNLLSLIKKIKITDISCGTGIFIIEYLEYASTLASLCEYSKKKKNEIISDILSNNIFGVDIQMEPLNILRLIIEENYGVGKDKLNLFMSNSVLGDEIYKDQKFMDVIESGGFDIVIGNPPYIGEKNHMQMFRDLRSHEFGSKFYEGKMDVFYYFIYRGIDILKKNGILSYLTTNYFVTADGAKKLRNHLKENGSFKRFINFGEFKLFKDALGQHNAIYNYVKEKVVDVEIMNFIGDDADQFTLSNVLSSKDVFEVYHQHFYEIFDDKGNINFYEEGKFKKIIDTIIEKSDSNLNDLCNINQGIVSGADRLTQAHLKKFDLDFTEENIGKGIFVLKENEIDFSSTRIKKFYKNSSIGKYTTTDEHSDYIIYLDDEKDGNGDEYLIKHLEQFEDILVKRREVITGTRPWYSLQWPRKKEIFEGMKIVVPQRAYDNKFAISFGNYYGSADIYYIKPKNTLEIYDGEDFMYYLNGILNSKLYYFWLYNCGKRKGKALELYSNSLKKIPIINLSIDNNSQSSIIDIVKTLISIKTKDGFKEDQDVKETVRNLMVSLDKLIYSIYELSDTEIEIVESMYRERNGGEKWLK